MTINTNDGDRSCNKTVRARQEALQRNSCLLWRVSNFWQPYGQQTINQYHKVDYQRSQRENYKICHLKQKL